METDPGIAGGAREGTGDALRALVVRRHPAADQAIGRGQGLDNIDLDPRKRLEQRGGGIKPARARADNSDGKRTGGLQVTEIGVHRAPTTMPPRFPWIN